MTFLDHFLPIDYRNYRNYRNFLKAFLQTEDQCKAACLNGYESEQDGIGNDQDLAKPTNHNSSTNLPLTSANSQISLPGSMTNTNVQHPTTLTPGYQMPEAGPVSVPEPSLEGGSKTAPIQSENIPDSVSPENELQQLASHSQNLPVTQTQGQFQQQTNHNNDPTNQAYGPHLGNQAPENHEAMTMRYTYPHANQKHPTLTTVHYGKGPFKLYNSVQPPNLELYATVYRNGGTDPQMRLMETTKQAQLNDNRLREHLYGRPMADPSAGELPPRRVLKNMAAILGAPNIGYVLNYDTGKVCGLSLALTASCFCVFQENAPTIACYFAFDY